MRVGLITLGCDKNTVDSERYLGELASYGAEVTTDLESADVIVVNTCGFIDAAKKESIDAIVSAADLKTHGVCRAVIAVGCMVQRHKAELAEALPEVDLFLGAGETERLVPELIARGLIDAEAYEHPGERVFAGELPHIRYLKVSEGCDHGCAFCAIPLMRGRHRSFALDDVVREAQLLEVQGAREINLVAQDLAHYGRDIRDGVRLPELLDRLLASTSVPWIRMLYLYSAGITPELLERMASQSRIVKYLDMPMQHGSDPVLVRMRRPERAETIRQTVARARSIVPDVAIRTTCIVGFPGETDDDFQRLLDLLEEVAFERVGIFTYSAQEGTRAAELPDDVPEPVKRERLERASSLVRAVTSERYEQRLGTLSRAIVNHIDGDFITGRLACQADDIDGHVIIQPERARNAAESASRTERAVRAAHPTSLASEASEIRPGTIVEVMVDEVVDDFDFRGTLRSVINAPSPAPTISPRRALPIASTPDVSKPVAAKPVASTVGSWGR